MLRDDFSGVWRRESLAIEDGEAFEDSNVLWLQAGDHFADIRWPLSSNSDAAVSAFAGRALWTPPRMSFNHIVDLTKEVTEDTGILSMEDGKLIEIGEISLRGKTIRFKEIWRQIAKGHQKNCKVATRKTADCSGYIVGIGGTVIAMEETKFAFCASAWQLMSGAWSELFCYGDDAELQKVRDALYANKDLVGWQQAKRVYD